MRHAKIIATFGPATDSDDVTPVRSPASTYAFLTHLRTDSAEAVPALRALGMKKKISFGPKAMPAMRALARMKRLRGTPLDVFGYAVVRRVERELLRQGARRVAGMDEVGRGALAGPVAVGVAVHRDGADTQPPQRPTHANGDLAAIRDQYLRYHRRRSNGR